MSLIPNLDLSNWMSGSTADKKAFAADLGKAYTDIGFVTIKNHGFSDAMQDQLYEEVAAFFALDTETKKKYELEKLAGQRGYTSFGREHAKGIAAADLKEFWHFGQYVENDDKLLNEYPSNVEVTENEQFNIVGKQTYRLLEKTSKYVLRALALYLKLDEFYFDKYIVNGNSILRPIHYPPIKGEPKGAVRAAAHGDINLITLLMGASAAGLEVQNKQGAWIPVTALPDQLVINVGDMLERLTNNKLRSTIHRVVNPPREEWGKPRYSIPFFTHPISEMSLNCLPECISHTHPKVYEDITAGEFLNERLRELGLLK